MMGDSPTTVMPDDEEVKLHRDVNNKVEDDEEDLKDQPNWLPDGWTMEITPGEDGTNYQDYTSPVSRFTFRMKSEVLNYLFSEMDERFLESKDCAAANKLSNTHEWLPKGWLIEVRAGGEKMDKMYKFYVYPAIGLRLFSKEDVLLYIKEMKISGCDTNGQCDTSSEDNILAKVEFNPSELPQGWVKEVVFRKTKKGIRKDPYYTDPVSHYVFRTLKSAMSYLETGNVTKRAFIQKTSVHDLYSFERSADLHECLRKRLMKNWKDDNQSSQLLIPQRASQRKETNCNSKNSKKSEEADTSQDSDSSNGPNEKMYKRINPTNEVATSSKTMRQPRGRPRKVVKQKHGKSNGGDPQIEQEEMVKIDG